ncbi:hypothetical protein NMG90_21610 [Bacillus mycoides]|uniref:hypothetical protein n=1 Tax=Bacillus mycoides TaxID=1405 RepID=UPI0020C972E1|nr:hypothetical protein [Bacillus mycoides]MCP9227943.1 hypothetical protein [Bacillus mycoides]
MIVLFLVFFTGENEPLPSATPVNSTLPLITVLPGQIVILDAYVRGDFFPSDIETEFGAGIEVILTRDGIPITNGNESVFYTIPNNLSPKITVNPSLTWVDSPPPGIYQYRLRIIRTTFNVDGTITTLGPLAIRAIIINTI